MPINLPRYLAPPDLADGDINRRARVLNIILVLLLVFTVLLLVVYFLFSPDPRFGHILVFAALAVEAASLWFLRAGNVALAGRVLVYSLWVVLMVSTLTSDGVRGTPILGQILLIVLSGILITEPLALTLGAFTILGNYFAMLLETNKGLIFPAPDFSLTSYWTIQSGYVLLALGLMLLLRRSMRANLEEARHSEQVLRDRVAELRQAQAQLEQSEQTLLRREAILETLRVAAENLFRDKSFDPAVNQVLKDLGKATGVDRVYLFENSTNWRGDLLTSQRYEWVAEGVKPEINNPDLQDLALVAGGFSRWIPILESNQVVKGHVRDFPKSERDVLSSQGILSIIIVPVFIGDEFWGFIGFDETKWERQWSPAEEDALRGAGGILGGAIERRRVEEALNQSEARYLGILQDQFDLICRYKPDGSLVFGNEAYLRFCGIERADMQNINMWDQVQPERLEGLRAKVHSLTLEEPVAVTQYNSRRGDGVMRWIEWTERGIFDQRGKLVEVQAVGRDIDEEIRLRKQIEESLLKTEMLAMTDALTGLLNRRAIMEHAEAEWNRALRESRPLSLVIMDVDHLKEINDTHGHLVGDQALSHVAGLIRGAMRRYDWAGRWGGDEFLLVLPGAQQRDAVDVAERLRQRINQSRLLVPGGVDLELHVTLGVANVASIDQGDSLQGLLARADQALYVAKQEGRDRVATSD